MKKLLLLLLFPMFATHFGFAQTYLPFVDTKSHWTLEFRLEGGWGPEYEYLSVLGTVTFGGIEYHELGGHKVREDSTGKVYGIKFGDTNEVLLYDFGLKVGDIFSFPNEVDTGMYSLALTSIDTVELGGVERRRYHFGTWGNTTWIEGIGNSDRGPLYYWERWNLWDSSKRLVCYRYDGMPLLGYCPPIGIDETTDESAQFRVYPNPVTSTSRLEFTTELMDRPTAIEIIDLTGRVVLAKPFHPEMTLQKGELDPGIYFVTTPDNTIQPLRFVVL